MEKKCFKCHQIKPLGSFYVHSEMADGHLNKCKECAKRDVIENYWSPEGRKRIIIYERERNKDPARKVKRLLYQRKARKNGRKIYVRNKTYSAIKRGLLKREPCEICGDTKVEAHHTDYSKPFDVKWLCRKHHLITEGKIPF